MYFLVVKLVCIMCNELTSDWSWEKQDETQHILTLLCKGGIFNPKQKTTGLIGFHVVQASTSACRFLPHVYFYLLLLCRFSASHPLLVSPKKRVESSTPGPHLTGARNPGASGWKAALISCTDLFLHCLSKTWIFNMEHQNEGLVQMFFLFKRVISGSMLVFWGVKPEF